MWRKSKSASSQRMFKNNCKRKNQVFLRIKALSRNVKRFHFYPRFWPFPIIHRNDAEIFRNNKCIIEFPALFELLAHVWHSAIFATYKVKLFRNLGLKIIISELTFFTPASMLLLQSHLNSMKFTSYTKFDTEIYQNC